MRLVLALAAVLAQLGLQAGAANRTKEGWDLRRRYVLTEQGWRSQGKESALDKFRILSWNVLAESWTTFGDLNKHLHKDLKWRHRVPRLLRELKARAPHIIVLQELEEYAYHWELLPELTAWGYQSIFAASPQSRVGVAVLWKTDHFFLSVATEVNLGEPYQSRWYLSMVDDLSKQQEERYLLLSANKVALFALLVPRRVRQKPKRHALLLCAAHLSAIVHEPPIGLDLQVFQAVLLMEALASMVQQQREKQISVSVIVAADLNTQASYPASAMDELSVLATGTKLDLAGSSPRVPSPVYDLFTQGFLSEDAIGLVVLALQAGGWRPSAMMFNEFREMLVEDWSGYALASAHSEALGGEPPTVVSGRPEQADYVLFQGGSGGVADLKLLGVLAPPRDLKYDELIKAVGSDHAPLVCDFALVRPAAGPP